MRAYAWVLVFWTFFAQAAQTKLRQEVPPSLQYKAWALGLSYTHYGWKVEKDYKVGERGLELTLSYGLLKENYLLLGDLKLLLGPFHSQQKGVLLDYSGIAFGLSAGLPLMRFPQEQSSHSFGLLSGLHYQEMKGESFTRTDFDAGVSQDTEQRISYTNRVGSVELSPGVYWLWKKQARVASHEKESLMTRNEACLLSVQASFPLWSYLHTESVYLQDPQTSVRMRNKAGVQGFHWLLSLRVFLGT